VWAVREVAVMCFLILARRGLCGEIGMGMNVGVGCAGSGGHVFF
jgi:hypothetical protein